MCFGAKMSANNRMECEVSRFSHAQGYSKFRDLHDLCYMVANGIGFLLSIEVFRIGAHGLQKALKILTNHSI